MQTFTLTRFPYSLLWLVPSAFAAWVWLPHSEITMLLILCLSLGAMNLFAFTLPRGDVICMQGGVAVAGIALASPQTVALAILATSLAVGSRGKDDDGIRFSFVALARTVLAAGVAVGYSIGMEGMRSTATASILVLGLSGAVFMLGDLMLYGIAYSGKGAPVGLRAGESLIKVLGAGYAAQVSVGLALALVYPRIAGVAFVVLVPLMAIMQHTTGMLLSVRAAYMRTISALARVAEMQAGGVPGHADRVSQLAAQVGRRMRLDSQQMERLSLSALLHEIGRLRDEGADTWDRLSSSGAEVLARISFLAGIAPVLSRMCLDARAFSDATEPDGVLARIVRACSDYDDLSDSEGSGASGLDLLGKMGRTPGEYDPDVLRHMRALVE